MRLPPARTRERRIQQLVVQAEDLVEERIRKGTASPTEVTALLKYGSEIEKANLDRIRAQTEYLNAQRAKAESETVREEMFTRAMEAMSRYSPDGG
jgi:mannose/cellobiose epimerase-like protein (N-acyl-D-glucosamine 2-epimerase family)